MERKLKLFIVTGTSGTGTSGTGKSTIVPLLRNLLDDSRYRVYDWDEIWEPYDFTDKWVAEVAKRSVIVTNENTQKGISTVIAGLIRPQWIEKVAPKIKTLSVQFCLLNIDVKERTYRLKGRGETEELIKDVEELEKLEKWLESSGYDFKIIDVTDLSPKETANSVAEWIRKEIQALS